jgi:3-hydroxyacyl-[acyl-carrier-protein] dehydratase
VIPGATQSPAVTASDGDERKHPGSLHLVQWRPMRPHDLLPHRPPFLFVDEIVDLVPGQSARGRWTLTGEEWFFAGHFPGRPTLPGVLMCEAIAQVGALAVLSDERYAGKLPLFGGLDGARFRKQVGPGDSLLLEVEMGRLSSRAGKGTGRALLDGAVATECELMFVIV